MQGYSFKAETVTEDDVAAEAMGIHRPAVEMDYLTAYTFLADALGYSLGGDGVKLRGCGLDVHQAMVRSLAGLLFDDPTALRCETL